jgi:hypothetical protein
MGSGLSRGQRPPRRIIETHMDVGPGQCGCGLPRRPISRSSATEYPAPPGSLWSLCALLSLPRAGARLLCPFRLLHNLGLFPPASLFCQFLPQRRLGLFRDLQSNTKLRRSGRLLHQPVGKFADGIAGRLCGNIRALLFCAEASRRLPLPLPRISKGLKAVYGDKPASPNTFTLGFSFNVALFDVPTDSARRYV